MDDLDDAKRYQEIERADRAKAVLENPVYREAFDELEQQLLVQMETTVKPEDVLQLHKMFVCNRRVKNLLAGHIETGKLAAIQLEQKRKFSMLKWGSN